MGRLNHSIVPTIRLSIIGLFLYALGAAAAASAILLPPNNAAHDRTVSATAATQLLQTGTLLLAPKDTWLNTNKNNYSTSTTLTTYTWPDYQVANAILMKFNLSALPAGAVVTEATLHLALVESDTAAESTYTVAAHKVVGKNPIIGKATGYSADGVIAWTANSCCYASAPLAQADISPAYDTQAIDKAPGFKAWTLTTMVQEWLLNPAANFGVALNSDASKLRDRYRTFASVEHADATLRPFLKVTFAAADVNPPSVAITTPPAGDISGIVPLAASATDNVGVASVQFQVNGKAACAEQTASPYSFNWDSTTGSDGTYAITAVARDTSGNVATSLPVSVTVKNGIVVLPAQDTWLNLDANNNSTDPLLRTYTWPDYQPANAILMKFDLASVPPGAVVLDAKLLLSLVESDATSTPLYTMTANKVVGRNPVIPLATGYTADGITSWSPNACCYDGVPLAQSDLSPPYATVAVDKTSGFKPWTITAMVQEWLADPLTNFGLVLNSDASKTGDHYRLFASMEHPDANLRPMLRVVFSTVDDTTPPTVAITAPAAGTSVSGVVTIAADASDDLDVAGVQLQLNGASLGAELTVPPYAFNWDSRSVANGVHTLTAVARDFSGNVAHAAPVTVTVENDITAPVIGAVTVSGVTKTAATITWTTDEPSDSQVEYGKTTSYGTLSPLAGAAVTTHSVTLSGLTHTSQYHFRMRSRDQAGNLATSAAFTFTTLDGGAPTVSVSAPAGGATVAGTITVTASASDNVGVAGVQFKLNGVNLGAEDTASPYSMSWNTTTVADGNHTLTAVARDAAGNVKTAGAITVTVANAPPPPPPPGSGLAALYPGDVGIENDPNVVLVERFDESTLANLFGKWTDVMNGATMSFSNDAPAGSAVGKSLTIPWSSGNTGGHLYRRLSQGVDDTLYVRYYVKYPSNNSYNHTGIWMGGYNPPIDWPNPQAGNKPTGSDRFSVAVEQNNLTNRFDHYNYWMGMRQSGDGGYWGNLLLNDPNVQATTDQWMCVEQMVKLNSPVTSTNGEHALWLNGVKVSHLGQGFPNGSWSGGIFTQDPGGSPFQGFQWRNTSNLNLNWIWLQVYATSGAGSLKYAHVVAAKSYIGCLASGSPSSTPPSVSMTAPAAGATVSGTVTVSANASDSVAVAGVQFKLDGANLGVEDTTAPYSVSWNTTGASNGSHTLTTVARNSAGLTTTASTVTVNVSNPVSGAWPNEPAGFTQFNNQPWDVMVGNGWNYLRRSATQDSSILTDTTLPFSPSKQLQITYTPGCCLDAEPGVHWLTVPSVREIFTGYWVKLSPNWIPNPAGGGKISFLFTDVGGQVYTNFYHPSDDGSVQGAPYRIGINTEWAPYGQHIWLPNVATTWINNGEWHRLEFYYKWETTPGVSRDGILRWWVDGQLNGNHTNVQYPAAFFQEMQLAPTVQYAGPNTRHMFFDHVYVSVR